MALWDADPEATPKARVGTEARGPPDGEGEERGMRWPDCALAVLWVVLAPKPGGQSGAGVLLVGGRAGVYPLASCCLPAGREVRSRSVMTVHSNTDKAWKRKAVPQHRLILERCGCILKDHNCQCVDTARYRCKPEGPEQLPMPEQRL